MMLFVDIFHCLILKKKKLFSKCISFHTVVRLRRHVLSSMLENLLFLATEQLSTHLPILPPDYDNIVKKHSITF